MLHVLLDSVSEAGAGPVVDVQNFRHIEDGTLQASITGIATVVLEGRTSEHMGWSTVDWRIAGGAARVSLFPQMRANVTSYGSGTVRVELVT